MNHSKADWQSYTRPSMVKDLVHKLAEDCLELHAKLEEACEQVKVNSERAYDLQQLLIGTQAELAKLRPQPKFRVGQLVHVRTWIACYRIERIDIAAGEIRYKLNNISTPQPPSELSAVLPEEIA